MQTTEKVERLNINEIIELDELKKLLPEVDDVAKENLRALIERDGIREPLSIAKLDGQFVLLDGHNRLRVARELQNIHVPVVYYPISDITEAEIWMVHNQLARRNMDTMDRIKIILQLEPQLQAEARERQRQGGQGVDISTPVGKVRDILAEMAGKSSTIIRQAKQILDTKDESLIAIADKNISINRAYKLAKLTPEKRELKLAVILQKITKEESEPATEESTLPELPETVTNGGIEYKKVSNMSYITKTDDLNFEVVSFERTLTGGFAKDAHDMLKINSAVSVTDGSAIIRHTPCILNQKSKAVSSFVSIHYSATSYHRIVSELLCVIDNMKIAKKLIDSARSTKEKADNSASKLAEVARKEQNAFKAIPGTYHDFYLTLNKKKQKEVLAVIHGVEQKPLAVTLNELGHNDWLVKENKRLERAKKKADRELEEKTGIPAMSAEEREAILNYPNPNQTDSDKWNQSEVKYIEADTTEEGLVFGFGKRRLLYARANLARAKEKEATPAPAPVTPTKASTPKKVAPKKKKQPFFSEQDLTDIREYYQTDNKVSNKALDSMLKVLKKDIVEESEIQAYSLGGVLLLDALKIMREKRATAPTPTEAPAPKKVAPKKPATKKPATKKPEPAEAPEPTAVATKNKRGSRQTGKKSK